MYCIHKVFIKSLVAGVDQSYVFFSSKRKATGALEELYRRTSPDQVLQYEKGGLLYVHNKALRSLISYKIHTVKVK